MTRIDALDWTLFVGVCLLGWFLAVYLKGKYKVEKRDFVVVSVYIAALASILIGVYHVIRGLLSLSP